MVDQEVLERQLKVDRFPFPCEGEVTLAVRNANYTLGPVPGWHVAAFQGRQGTRPAHHQEAALSQQYACPLQLLLSGPRCASSSQTSARAAGSTAAATLQPRSRTSASTAASEANAPCCEVDAVCIQFVVQRPAQQ